ncbi:hypothetical protein AB6A40_006206 [Gnathostoma spinigerum]|uniref:Uncharacterized protein n=1 Tax=Gnathostoma spinigerum TaxID=75299 RepID=A0ABD6EJW5_9BILA
MVVDAVQILTSKDAKPADNAELSQRSFSCYYSNCFTVYHKIWVKASESRKFAGSQMMDDDHPSGKISVGLRWLSVDERALPEVIHRIVVLIHFSSTIVRCVLFS